jgi:hypothetical protein
LQFIPKVESIGFTMALVVSTPPPDMVVKTRAKKGRTRVDESPIMCDSLWACLLNDYLDDSLHDDLVDSGIVENSPQRQKQETRPERRRRRSKKRKPKNLGNKNTEKVSEESDTQAADRELETLLSDDHEIDQLKKEVAESSRSNDDIVLDILAQDNETETEPEKTTDRVSKKGKERTPRVIVGPAEEGAEYTKEEGAKDKSDVFHYAPLSHVHQKGKKQGSVNRQSRDPGAADQRTSTGPSRRVPIEPDDEPRLVNRTSRFRGGDHTKYSNDSSSALPRDQSISEPKPHSARPLVSRKARTSMDRNGSSKVETIDLTEELFHSSSLQDDANTRNMTHNDAVERGVLESKRRETDRRRRKLDRKEALERIRAIKARLNTANPGGK